MYVSKEILLQQLPPYRDEWELVHRDQEVKDIISEMSIAHQEFAPYYDTIALYFDAATIGQVCKNLYDFCKKNIKYREETEDAQTTALPTGILTRGYGDCKHYASFCAGVLDALGRATGKKIKWQYRFASYQFTRPTPYHVFVVVEDEDGPIWIDPTPGAEGKIPVWEINQKVSGMALYRNISGTETDNVLDQMFDDPQIREAMADVDLSSDLPLENWEAVEYLLNAGVLNKDGSVNWGRLNSSVDYQAAFDVISNLNAIGTSVGEWILFQTAVVSMAVPRAAFLGLVAINAFGMATKMAKILLIPSAKDKLADRWWHLGGKLSALESAVEKGKNKKALLKISNGKFVSGDHVGEVGTAAILAGAAAVIAAIMPLVGSLLKQNNIPDEIPIDPSTGLPYGQSASAGSGVLDFFIQNPVIVFAAAGLLAWWFYQDNE